jgi:hypothetical protein
LLPKKIEKGTISTEADRNLAGLVNADIVFGAEHHYYLKAISALSSNAISYRARVSMRK